MALITDETRARLEADARDITARYPVARSALLPMLHLVQGEEGFVSPDGIAFCAQMLDLTTAEVAAVATFYTMYKRHPNGTYTVGVCTNTLCAVMGGDEIFRTLSEHLGIGNDETTPDGAITLERVECNAACDYAPVVMVNWEFFDNQTPSTARDFADRLQAGDAVAPSRGASTVCTFKQMSRVLAGFSDGRANEGVAAGPATLRGTLLAEERGWEAPPGQEQRQDGRSRDEAAAPAEAVAAESAARSGSTSASDVGPVPPASDRGGTTAGKPAADATNGTADTGRATTPRPTTAEGAVQKERTDEQTEQADGTRRDEAEG
jgi:NADH-quinone oxidoreductase subunit E